MLLGCPLTDLGAPGAAPSDDVPAAAPDVSARLRALEDPSLQGLVPDAYEPLAPSHPDAQRIARRVVDDIARRAGLDADLCSSDLLGIGTAPPDPALQFLKAWGGQKNLKPIRETATHLAGTFQLNLQKHRAPRRHLFLSRTTGSAVAIPCEFRPLQKTSLLHQGLKPRTAVEEVVDAVLLPLARRTGGGRHRQPNLGMALQQLVHQGSLADSTGTGDQGELSTGGHRGVCVGQQSRKPQCPTRCSR